MVLYVRLIRLVFKIFWTDFSLVDENYFTFLRIVQLHYMSYELTTTNLIRNSNKQCQCSSEIQWFAVYICCVISHWNPVICCLYMLFYITLICCLYMLFYITFCHFRLICTNNQWWWICSLVYMIFQE